jgi:hypothetical protein
MINEAKSYLSEKKIRRREPLYSANRAAKILGDIPIESLQITHLETLRRTLSYGSLSPRTIESTISDLITLHRHYTGSHLQSGSRLQVPQPCPSGVNHDIINAIWPACSPWVRSWVALTMWSGLRLSDALRVLLKYRLQNWPDTLVVVASKTGKTHTIPVPLWLRKILTEGPYRFRTVSDFSRRALRNELRVAGETAGVPSLTPKHFRQEGITQWTIANASAGAVVHGAGLKVLGHYVVQAALLEKVSSAVTMPECFGACTVSSDRLMDTFRRLDPQAQELISKTAERLAAG